MHLRVWPIVALTLLLVVGTATLALGQQRRASPQPAPTREQVHPQLVDSTWGRRVAAAWQQAFAHRWDDARASFAALHTEQPLAVDALLGLGFVARADGQLADARRWLRAAYAVEPTEDIRKSLEATDYDRRASIDLSTGAASANGTTTSQWSAGALLPLDPRFALTLRAGALGAGDPIHGIFLDSANSGRAYVLSGGFVARPIDGTTLGAHFDHWTSSFVNENYLSFDAAQRLGDHLTAHVNARPVSGVFGAPQVGGGVDVVVLPNQVVAVNVQQGLRAATFEARTQVSAFYFATPSVRASFRVGAIRDVDPVNSATTGLVSGTWFLRPTTGLRVELSARRGAFAQTAANVGLVLRW